MSKIKWIKLNGEHVTEYRTCSIERSGTHRKTYTVRWHENLHYAAPHYRYSFHDSLQSAKRAVDSMLKREASEPNTLVYRFDPEVQRKEWGLRKLRATYEDYADALKNLNFSYARYMAKDYNALLTELGGPEKVPGESYLSFDPTNGLNPEDVAKRDRIAELAEKYANQGHYLTRLKNIARITGNAMALKHARNLISLHEDCGCQPNGSKEVQYEISRMILSHCVNELRFTQEQIDKLWYGVQHDIRDSYDMTFPYDQPTHAMRANMGA